MSSDHIAVPFRNSHLTLTAVEAQSLLRDLQIQLDCVRESVGEMRPPEVSDDGFIDTEALYAFFAQIYPDSAKLNRHVGRLLAPLVRVATYNGVPFVVICKLCGRNGTQQCGRAGDFHISLIRNLKFEVASLKEHQTKFLDDYIRSVGPVIKEDFRTLLSYL